MVETSKATHSGWHVGRIPWDAIDAWGCRHGLSVESIDLLVEVIRQLDDDREEQQAADFLAVTSGG